MKILKLYHDPGCLSQLVLNGWGSIPVRMDTASSIIFLGTLRGYRGLLSNGQNERNVTLASGQYVPWLRKCEAMFPCHGALGTGDPTMCYVICVKFEE
jgi:hypothetical protein